MNAERWRQVTGIFHAALARDAGTRATFLSDACQGDASLRAEVDALIAAHGEAGSFGDVPLFADGAPRLSPGTRLGTYQIQGLIGAGGMGEVYRAHDPELRREVAIKILPGAWLADPDRRARLDTEARLLAALNHPHVAAIYGVAEADGVRGLVLELVEGASLAERVSDGPLPLTEALSVARQIADALDATHEKGIVHRDLKPANIKITPDGVVKVLDFGVAMVRQAEPSLPGAHEWPTATAGRTGDEAIVGTAAYMSPEQARGKPVDKRADIWAFGCVLYEMLSGRRAFEGETATDVLAAIIGREPEWNALPSTVPSSVRHLLERCLEKDPKRRLRDIGDARVELDESRKSHAPAGMAAARESRFRPFTRSPAVGAAVLAALIVAIVSLTLPYIGSRFGRTPPSAAGDIATSAADPTVVPLTTYTGTEDMPSLSPDGNMVAFRWDGEAEDNFDIYFKLVGPGDPHQLTTDPAPDYLPKWSPDGKWIAFLREEATGGQANDALLTSANLQYRLGVYVIPALGGAERRVGDATVLSLAWTEDSGALVISRSPTATQSPGLFMVSRETSQMSQLTSPDAPYVDSLAAVAPSGDAIAFVRSPGPVGGRLMVLPVPLPRSPLPMKVGDDKRIGIGSFAWSADGRDIIYTWGAGVSFLWRIALPGNSQPQRLSFAGEGAADPAAARTGSRLVFSRSFAETNIWSLELDERGAAKGQAARAFDSSRDEFCPAFSPDGTRVAFESNRSGTRAVWVCPINGSDCSQLTHLPQRSGSPAWSPDGEWIAFDALEDEGGSIYIIRPDGGRLQMLAKGGVPRWSRDGRWIYYGRRQRLYRVARTGGDPQEISGTAGGSVAEESWDGQIYYSGHPVTVGTKLRRIPMRGGEATDVFSERVSGRNFAVAKAGIWYLTASPSLKEGSLLQFYDFASKRTRTVHRTSAPVFAGLTLAPDESRILFTQQDRRGRDLMLVENFR